MRRRFSGPLCTIPANGHSASSVRKVEIGTEGKCPSRSPCVPLPGSGSQRALGPSGSDPTRSEGCGLRAARPLLLSFLLRPFFDDPLGGIVSPPCQAHRLFSAFLIKELPWCSVMGLIAIIGANMLFKPQFPGDLSESGYLRPQTLQQGIFVQSGQRLLDLMGFGDRAAHGNNGLGRVFDGHLGIVHAGAPTGKSEVLFGFSEKPRR